MILGFKCEKLRRFYVGRKSKVESDRQGGDTQADGLE